MDSDRRPAPARWLSFDGLAVEVRVSDARLDGVLAPVFGGLGAASAPDAPAEVTVAVSRRSEGDARSEGLAPAFFHGRIGGFGDDDAGWALRDEVGQVTVRRDGPRTQLGVEVDEAAVRDPVFTRTTLFIAWAIALHGLGRYHVHAATLVPPGGDAVLLVGPSGTGKSSTAVALALAGWQALGDDAAFLVHGRHVRVAPMPKPFHLHDHVHRALGRWPALPDGEAPAGKRALRPPPYTGPWPARIGALWFTSLRQDGGPTRRLALPRNDALGLLVESSAFSTVEGLRRRADHERCLAELAATADECARLELGPDLLRDPATVAARLVPA